MRQHQSVLLCAPPGFGKTYTAGYIARSAQEKGKIAIFAVHRRELMMQTAVSFKALGVQFSYIAAGMHYNPRATVYIASADTLRSRLHLLEKCDLFVPDEAHLWGVGKTRVNIINTARGHGAKILPLTGTPQAGNGKGLKTIADHIVMGPTTAWLIENGHLAKYKAYAPVKPDLKGLHVANGDYIPAELEERLGKASIIGDRVGMYLKFARDKRMIGYCYSRDNGQRTAAAFLARGVAAEYIDGETPHNLRREIIERFADGITKVLINVALFREGFDLSSQVGRDVPIQAVGLYAPTKSLPVAIQMMMRALRKQDGYAIIIDHANILETHGLPDEEREWDLDGKIVKENGKVPTMTCKKCSFQYRIGPKECPDCGYEPEKAKDPRVVEEIDGELEEIDIEAMKARRKRAIHSARSVEALCKVAVQQAKQPGWVFHTMKARGDKPPSYPTVLKLMQEYRRAG